MRGKLSYPMQQSRKSRKAESGTQLKGLKGCQVSVIMNHIQRLRQSERHSGDKLQLAKMRLGTGRQSSVRSELQSLRTQLAALQEQLDLSQRCNERQERLLSELQGTLAEERRVHGVAREVAKDYLVELATTRRQLAEAAVLAEVGLAAAEAALAAQPTSRFREPAVECDDEDAVTEEGAATEVERLERSALVSGALRVLHALDAAEAPATYTPISLQLHPPRHPPQQSKQHRRQKHRSKHQHQHHNHNPCAPAVPEAPRTLADCGTGELLSTASAPVPAEDLLRAVKAAVRPGYVDSLTTLSSIPTPPSSSSAMSVDLEAERAAPRHGGRRGGGGGGGNGNVSRSHRSLSLAGSHSSSGSINSSSKSSDKSGIISNISSKSSNSKSSNSKSSSSKSSNTAF